MLDQRFGPLRVRLSPELPGQSPPAQDPRALVVLLHGYGASGSDLVPLASYYNAPPARLSALGVRFAFPEAPLKLSPVFDSRAWWAIDLEALEAALAAGTHRDRTVEDPPGMSAATDALASCLDALERELRPRRLIVGGFSQGSMLACDLVARGRQIDGLMVLSGTLLAADRWRAGFAALSASRKSRAGAAGTAQPALPVFQSHGHQDPLLGMREAELLRDSFISAGFEHRWSPFVGAHEIPPSVLSGSSQFIADLVGRAEGDASAANTGSQAERAEREP